MRRSLISTVAVLALTCCTTTHAATITVGPSGDYSAIQPALSAAGEGDTVLVAPGVYSGADNNDLDFAGVNMLLKSESGASVTTIDGGGSNHLFWFTSGEALTSGVEGFTLTNASGDSGGAVRCRESSPTFTDCDFSWNDSYHGGAIYCYQASPSITGCTFSNCTGGIGMALYTTASSSPTVTDCEFVDCTGASVVYCEHGAPAFTGCSFARNTGDYCGGVYLYDSPASFDGCLFWENTCNADHRGGGALYCDTASPILASCTFSDNGAEGVGGTVHCWGSSPTFDRCIIAFGTAGPALDCNDSQPNGPTLACCDVYGNAGGDWVGCIAGQGELDANMNADPLFCGRAGRDYRLHTSSPCAAAQSTTCGLIGALDVACDSAVGNATWGAIKALYR